MPCRFEPHWRYHGLECLRLENEYLGIWVLPDLGGKIWSLRDKRADVELLWHSPRVLPHTAPLHANFDDHWSGGWDEAFPVGAPSRNRYGDDLPYLGELWTTPASWQLRTCSADLIELELTVLTPITPARWRRLMRLRAGSPALELEYEIENVGTMPFEFMWGLHPVQAVTTAHRLDVPAEHAEVDEQGGAHLGRTGQRYAWPMLGKHDVSTVLPESTRCFALHYLTGLREGWVATTDTASHRGFGLVFDVEVFPVVWLWMVYGGWRGYHHAMAEPWTASPARLDEVAAAGRARELDPGATLRTSVAAVVYSGIDRVGSLRADGTASRG